MERHFERDLNDLKERLLWMGSLAERAVLKAVHSVWIPMNNSRIGCLLKRRHQ